MPIWCPLIVDYVEIFYTMLWAAFAMKTALGEVPCVVAVGISRYLKSQSTGDKATDDMHPSIEIFPIFVSIYVSI
jgi:hypothetical protein